MDKNDKSFTEKWKYPLISIPIIVTAIMLSLGFYWTFMGGEIVWFDTSFLNQDKEKTIETNMIEEQNIEEEVELILIPDTDQQYCFNNSIPFECPSVGEFAGQDAQYESNDISYNDNNDGTITDQVTGLMWTADPGEKVTYNEAISRVSGINTGGYTDWRVPTIKELYSLIRFSGMDVSADSDIDEEYVPFIDDRYFKFSYGDPNDGDRIIDSQWVTSSIYNSTVMNGQECFFGVNFADGRIKCYPTKNIKKYFAIYVRGENYGESLFINNGDTTITDKRTGLIWMQNDNGEGVLWSEALKFCEDLSLAGFKDWRLPNAKELQYIVDYSRSPDVNDSPAIDPMFTTTEITNEAGEKDYPFFWTSTTHIKFKNMGDSAIYLSFGRALGNMSEFGGWVDVHGAGAQRSDPKSGVTEEKLNGFGPQGDAVRSYNYVRCLREGAEFIQNNNLIPKVEIQNSDQSSNIGNDQNTSGQEPPEEAVKVCQGKNISAGCSFQIPGEFIIGTCQSTINNTIACVPQEKS